MASDKAVMLAHTVLDNVRESNLEISGSGNVKMAATIIDAALTEASLEGARAMQEYIAEGLEWERPNNDEQIEEYIDGWPRYEPYCKPRPSALKRANLIRALAPEQVINERAVNE